MKNSLIYSIIFGSLVLWTVTGANANSLVNGSFESPAIEPVSYLITDQTNVPGWKTTGDGNMEIWSTGFNGTPGGPPVFAADGNQFIELNANVVGTVYQDVAGFKAGDILDWSFAHRARIDFEPLAKDTLGFAIIELGVGSGGADITTYFNDISGNGFTDAGDKWYYHSGTFTVSATSTLRFMWTSINYTSSSVGNFLDDAKFDIHGNPVPEPATMLLFGAGLAGLGGLKLRSRA